MTLENLLNILCKKGWKPFWRETKHELSSWVVYDTIDIKWKGDIRVIDRRHHHIRELVSKESWLRQFCVENKLVKEDDGHVSIIINVYKDYESIVDGWWDYHYWLMICSILDESDLEQFLIDNIKIS